MLPDLNTLRSGASTSFGPVSATMKAMRTTGRPAQLEAKIDTLKQELTRLGDLRPGTLSEQYNVCGKAGCACKADPPRKHAVLPGELHVAGPQPDSIRAARKRGAAPPATAQLRETTRAGGGVDRRGAGAFALAVGGSACTPSSPPSGGPSRQILTKSRRERAVRPAYMCRNWLSDREFSGFDTETS